MLELARQEWQGKGNPPSDFRNYEKRDPGRKQSQLCVPISPIQVLTRVRGFGELFDKLGGSQEDISLQSTSLPTWGGQSSEAGGQAEKHLACSLACPWVGIGHAHEVKEGHVCWAPAGSEQRVELGAGTRWQCGSPFYRAE